MDDLKEIQETLERHMLKFTLENGPDEYEDIVHFINANKFSRDKVMDIYKRLVNSPFAESREEDRKGYLKLTKRGRAEFQSKFCGRPPGTFIPSYII